MEIIERGIRKTDKRRVRCEECRCLFEVSIQELECNYNWKGEMIKYVWCPCCNRFIDEDFIRDNAIVVYEEIR